MGTSASNKGPGPRAPMVPPWADSNPNEPLPEPTGQRFRGFRTAFGQAVAGGGSADTLTKALRKYASDATGGAAVGPRRFGPAYAAGANLANLITDLGAGGTGEETVGANLGDLAGQPIDVAAQEIAKALAPDNADADQVAAAIQSAMAEVLVDQVVFDPAAITPDQLVQLLVEFFAQILFQQITGDAGEAWNHSPSVDRTTATERDLLALIRAVADKHFSGPLTEGLGDVSRSELARIEKAAMVEIWHEWGG